MILYDITLLKEKFEKQIFFKIMSKEKEIVKEICETYYLKENDISPDYLFEDN